MDDNGKAVHGPQPAPEDALNPVAFDPVAYAAERSASDAAFKAAYESVRQSSDLPVNPPRAAQRRCR